MAKKLGRSDDAKRGKKKRMPITRIKSRSNLLIFLVCFFCVCLFFVCLCFLFVFLCVCVGCSTCYVLILSQIISACSMSSEIHHLQLKFASFRFFFFNCG